MLSLKQLSQWWEIDNDEEVELNDWCEGPPGGADFPGVIDIYLKSRINPLYMLNISISTSTWSVRGAYFYKKGNMASLSMTLIDWIDNDNKLTQWIEMIKEQTK